MKLQVIPLVWMLVPAILAYVQYSVASGGPFTANPWEPTLRTLLVLLLLVVEIVVVYIAVQHVMIGAIRFARTGRMREAFDQLAIRATIGRIGIVNYFVGMGVIAFIWLLFSLTLRGIALLPFAGPGISLILAPIPTIYCFRFIAHFCDEDRLQAGFPAGMAGPSASRPAPATEYLSWLAIYTVLLVLCFSPLALVVGSVTGFFR
jgi:hypothetical protein